MSTTTDKYVTVNGFTVDHPQYERLKELTAFYKQQFNELPEFYVKVPGRVNLIGEHVDYCGFPVLPMASQQSILLAVRVGGAKDQLQLRNISPHKFKNYDCDLGNISIENTAAGLEPAWHNYFLCGVKGILDTLAEGTALQGMRVAVCGNIPPAAGLSSSSALVSAAVLATAKAHQLALNAHRLAAISANCERYIGTEGGGMDQAIAYLAKSGCAQFIEFHPRLSATPIRLPPKVCFVVAHTLVKKNKAASADFNERVVECRLATRFLANVMKLPDWHNYTKLKHLQKALACDLNDLQKIIIEHLHQDIYTRDELLQIFETTESEFMNFFLTPNTHQMILFKLKQRALHVIQESLRVVEFRSICENTLEANEDKWKSAIKALSKLMRESHQSLQVLYECSHPSLDRLVALSDQVGVGARVTGAGWGGFIVALCLNEQEAAEYIKILKKEYYQHISPQLLAEHQHNDFADVIFATSPCAGAELIELEISQHCIL